MLVRRQLFCVLPVMLPLMSMAPLSHAQVSEQGGRISGRVVDASSGRPLPMARVTVANTSVATATDLDGRFRTGVLTPGFHSVSVTLIGFTPARQDSVEVVEGTTATITVAMTAFAVELSGVVVSTEVTISTSSAAGLLAAQKSAAAVTDGISAQTMSKAPDSDAEQAVRRVPGLSTFDNKVIIRGAPERYSIPLLNGVDIASPDPEKKFVGLDNFAAGLLDAIVASKTATPDKPADFAGGMVDIQTKEFPENFVMSFGVSQGYNSRSTFRDFARAPRAGSDAFAFDGRGRGIPRSIVNDEVFAENLSNIWTPAPRRAAPDLGADFAIGGRKDIGEDVFGYILSVNYSNGRAYNPDRFDNLGEAPFLFNDATERVDLGGILNLAYRAGPFHKFGLKNFYTRYSSELLRSSLGAATGEGPSLNYQAGYLQQYVSQSQITGDHLFPAFANSRVEWKASIGRASRQDLDNRQLRYIKPEVGGGNYSINEKVPSFRHNALLYDRTFSGQIDWSLPVRLIGQDDAMLKIGGLRKERDRDFDARSLELDFGETVPQEIKELPPEQLLAPENLAPNLISYSNAGTLTGYTGTEDVTAAYGMLDVRPFTALRFVGGVRWERWNASLKEGNGAPNRYNTSDPLYSANVTVALSTYANLRFAGYQTVARPDLRELSPGGYAADVGGYPVIGDTTLTPSKILNGDIRFELYPSAEELFAVSLFYKLFDQPLLVVRTYAGGNVITPVNGDEATTIGAEFEVRKNLAFIAPAFERLLVNGNLTLLRSRIKMPARLGAYEPDLQFMGLSPYLLNLGATYTAPGTNSSLTVLFNRFGDRITQYGSAGTSGEEAQQGYNIIEKARSSLDAKLKVQMSGKWSVSLSGKNLLNSASELAADKELATQIRILGRSYQGISLSSGLSYVY